MDILNIHESDVREIVIALDQRAIRLRSVATAEVQRGNASAAAMTRALADSLTYLAEDLDTSAHAIDFKSILHY